MTLEPSGAEISPSPPPIVAGSFVWLSVLEGLWTSATFSPAWRWPWRARGSSSSVRRAPTGLRVAPLRAPVFDPLTREPLTAGDAASLFRFTRLLGGGFFLGAAGFGVYGFWRTPEPGEPWHGFHRMPERQRRLSGTISVATGTFLLVQFIGFEGPSFTLWLLLLACTAPQLALGVCMLL